MVMLILKLPTGIGVPFSSRMIVLRLTISCILSPKQGQDLQFLPGLDTVTNVLLFLETISSIIPFRIVLAGMPMKKLSIIHL